MFHNAITKSTAINHIATAAAFWHTLNATNQEILLSHQSNSWLPGKYRGYISQKADCARASAQMGSLSLSSKSCISTARDTSHAS
jgi:hypothetical protein